MSFRFLHDRVRQAAYSLLPETERAERHTQVGLRLLEDARATGTLEERAFVILPHLAYAPEKIEPLELRLELADIHLRAGRRAKASGAYRTACELFRAGNALLGRLRLGDASTSGPSRSSWSWPSPSYLASELDRGDARASPRCWLRHARPTQKATVIAMQATLASLNSQHAEAIRAGPRGAAAARGGGPHHRGSGRAIGAEMRRGDASCWGAASPRSCSRCHG